MAVNPMIEATIKDLFITIDVIEPLGLFSSSTDKKTMVKMKNTINNQSVSKLTRSTWTIKC